MSSNAWSQQRHSWKRAGPPARSFLWLFLATVAIVVVLVDARGATLGYATYFGASHYDGAYAVAVDAVGNAFVAGSTDSPDDFPLLNPFQGVYGGGDRDAFLAKFDPDGHLIFSTFFGGSGYDAIDDLALDRDGNLIVVGETHSVDLPSTDDACQHDYAGGSAFGSGDGFIAKFSPDGTQLLYCSYFGGNGDEKINSLAITASGRLCVTGQTDSRNLPLKNSLQPAYGGGDSDGFIAQFDATLTNLVFSTYFGGEGRDEDQKIAVDPAGFVYLCGSTLSTNFPVTAGAFQTSHVVVTNIGLNWDAFVTKLKPDGSSLTYSTYVGDAMNDEAFAVAADADGSAYVTGAIRTGWDPGTFPLGFQPTPSFGSGDAWVAKLRPDGSNFEWFSYLGGSGEDIGYDIALDKDNHVFVTGITDSIDFPTADAPQPKFGGGHDAFVAKISADGKRLVYSTYLGGSNEEWGYAIAPDFSGNLISVGQTVSINFPIRNAVQTTNASLRTIVNAADAYVLKLSPTVEPPPLKIARSADNVLITWSTAFTGFVLESTPELASTPPNWKAVSNAPVVLGGQFTFVQRISEPLRAFRLRRP